MAQAVAAGRFHQPPIGPIGSKLTLQDDKWARAVEASIGRALSTFVVHDFADQGTLRVSLSLKITVRQHHELHSWGLRGAAGWVQAELQQHVVQNILCLSGLPGL